jgi:hypothetical protein
MIRTIARREAYGAAWDLRPGTATVSRVSQKLSHAKTLRDLRMSQRVGESGIGE